MSTISPKIIVSADFINIEVVPAYATILQVSVPKDNNVVPLYKIYNV